MKICYFCSNKFYRIPFIRYLNNDLKMVCYVRCCCCCKLSKLEKVITLYSHIYKLKDGW